MPKLTYERATKTKSKLRMAFTGPAKSGKTYTALVLATALVDAEGGTIGLIDTEHGSSRKYADIFAFDIMELEEFHPNSFIEGIEVFEAARHAVVILDSLSHAWIGKRGVLELHDDATAASRSKDSYISWRTITPLHRALIDKMLSANCHIIATMRSKMAYLRDTDDRGKTTIRKVGLAPVQRQGMEYEFDILAEMHHDHRIVIGDTRCPTVDGKTQMKPDAAWFQPILDWLDGEEPTSPDPEEPEKMRPQEPGVTRPYSPQTVKEGILSRASKGDETIAKHGFRGLVIGYLEAVWLTEKPDVRAANRHSVLNYLFGDPSSKKLTTRQCKALLSWTTDEQPGGTPVLNAYAVAEANAILNLWNEKAGQQRLEMPVDEELLDRVLPVNDVPF